MSAGGGSRGLAAAVAVLFFGQWAGADDARPVAGRLDAAQVIAVEVPLQLVVLNIGRDGEARVGMPLVVWRGDRPIGRVRVVEVRRRVCGAVIEQVEPGVTPAAGDAAAVARSGTRQLGIYGSQSDN